MLSQMVASSRPLLFLGRRNNRRSRYQFFLGRDDVPLLFVCHSDVGSCLDAYRPINPCLDPMQHSAVILLPAHPASFAHKFLFQRVPGSPGMQ